MKLILERWDNFLNEAFEACDTPFKVGDLKLATDIVKYLDDQEAANEYQAQLAKSPFKRFLNNAKFGFMNIHLSDQNYLKILNHCSIKNQKYRLTMIQ